MFGTGIVHIFIKGSTTDFDSVSMGVRILVGQQVTVEENNTGKLSAVFTNSLLSDLWRNGQYEVGGNVKWHISNFWHMSPRGPNIYNLKQYPL